MYIVLPQLPRKKTVFLSVNIYKIPGNNVNCLIIIFWEEREREREIETYS